MQMVHTRQFSREHPAGIRQRGASLVELVIAGMLLSSIMVSIVPMLKLVNGQGRLTDERQEALAEVSNIMERIIASPFAELSNEKLKQFRVSPHVTRQLRQPELTITATPDPDRAGMLRIEVELDWVRQTRRREPPVCLVAWVHDLQRRSTK